MQNAEKISVTLTPEMLRVIRESVSAGEYASTSEVLRDAFRVWERERSERRERLDAIRARVNEAMDDPRPRLSFEEVDDRLKAYMESHAKRFG